MSGSTIIDLKPIFQLHALRNSGARVNRKPKKRLAPLSVRLSAGQRAQLEQDAVGMSLNAYVLSRLFDDPQNAKPKRQRRPPTKRDKAIARALRQLSQSGLAAYLANQIAAYENGHLPLSEGEELQLREAYAACRSLRNDLIEAQGLRICGEP